jgi:CheY-like chemotaxis protein
MTRVLVVDDEPDVLDSTAQVLAANGFEVETVGQAAQILPALRRFRPALLLQDINMPDFDVDRLVPQIRADPQLRGLRILLFSASESIEESAQRVGADGYVQKPFDARRIRQVLERALAGPATAAHP